MQQTILIISAHHDDSIIGAGGTIAKYAEEGKRVHTVILAHDRLPHLKKDVAKKKTERQSKKATKILGETHTTFLGENPFDEIKEIIKTENPEMIFTHDSDDADPAHRKVNQFVIQLLGQKVIKCPIYSFAIYSFGRLKKRELPRLVVDVSKTFDKKVEALLAHQSKWITLRIILWEILIQGKLSGWRNGMNYAEVFYKIN